MGFNSGFKGLNDFENYLLKIINFFKEYISDQAGGECTFIVRII